MTGAPVHLSLGRVSQLESAALRGGLGWMSSSEHVRLESLSLPARRAQFIAGRWAARSLLEHVHGTGEPRQWSLTAWPDRRPALEHGGQPALHIGISHSAGHVACAVSAEPVGVDIESTLRERDFRALARAMCTHEEQALMDTLQGPALREAFYAGWTLKEAWIKLCEDAMTPGRMARIGVRGVSSADGDALAANGLLWRGHGFMLSVVGHGPPRAVWTGAAPGAGSELWHVRPQAAAS
jgi:4'-phosphopantetheinyl transferase